MLAGDFHLPPNKRLDFSTTIVDAEPKADKLTLQSLLGEKTFLGYDSPELIPRDKASSLAKAVPKKIEIDLHEIDIAKLMGIETKHEGPEKALFNRICTEFKQQLTFGASMSTPVNLDDYKDFLPNKDITYIHDVASTIAIIETEENPSFENFFNELYEIADSNEKQDVIIRLEELQASQS